MGFWDRIGDMWPWRPGVPETQDVRWVEEKASAAGQVISGGYTGQPVWTPRQYGKLADEAYVRNAVGFRCIKYIAAAAAAVPWLLSRKGGVEVEEHAILDLLKRPAPMVGGAFLFEAFYSYLLASGNGYMEGVGPNDTAPPRELWTHRPDRMKVVAGRYGLPEAYTYEANGQSKRWDVDPVTGRGAIMHVREFHPLNDWYGLGRIEPAAYGIDRHNAASAHNKALLDNGARPSGALVFQPIKVDAQGTMQSAPEKAIQAAEKKLKQSHIGPTKAGKPMVFGGLVDWLEMGLSPKDMDFAEGKDDAAWDVCLSFGVPPILIVKGQATYNNIREAKLELYEETVLPLVDKVVDSLDAWLTPQFEAGLRLGVDLDRIPALEPRRESKRKSVLDLVEKGLLDADEGRAELDYGPRAPLAVKKVDAAVLRALVDGAAKDATLYEPLLRYMASVGLVEPGTTIEQLLEAAQSVLAQQDLTEPDAPAPTEEDQNAPPA